MANEQKSLFQKVFNLNLINLITLFMFVIAVIIAIIFDLNRLSENLSINGIKFIYLRDWFVGAFTYNSYLNLIAISISFLASILSFLNLNRIKSLLKEKITNNRRILFYTSLYLGIGRLLEGLYLTFDTDFEAVLDIVFQFYITLDVLTMVLFVSMGFSLFISGEENEDLSNKNGIVFIIAMISYITGYIMTILYGISPEGFAIGTYISGAMLLIMAVISIKTSIDMFSLSKRVSENKNAIFMMSIQLLLFVVTIILLIATGLTVGMLRAGNIWPNRLLRIIRLSILLVITYFYIPAYIRPAERTL